MAELRVTPELMLSLADRMKMASDDLASDTLEIQYLLSELDNQLSVRWVNDADKVFTHRIDTAKDRADECKRLCGVLNEISSNLRAIYEASLNAEQITVTRMFDRNFNDHAQ